MSKKEKIKEQQTENVINNQNENIQAVNEETESSVENTEEQIEQNEAQYLLEKTQEEMAELKDKYLRTMAEFENYKKRTHKEKAELIFNGGEKTISAILPILDDMERAIDNAPKTTDIQALEEGWELIFKKLQNVLEGLGVKKIETENKDFDIDFHEAVAMVPGVDDDKKGKVIDCVQTGYTLNDKVIRHAKVAIGQ